MESLQAKRDSLLGRSTEFERLCQYWINTLRGVGGVVCLTGEPGIGKTHLIEALATQAVTQGAIALWGGATDMAGMPPYLPFLQALGDYIRKAPLDMLHAHTLRTAPVLSTLFPELALRQGDAGHNYTVPPEQGKLRLYEAISALLQSIALTQPLLLILDDLHWAEPATLDLLCHIAQTMTHNPMRMLVLGSYQPHQAQSNPALQRALAELHRLRIFNTIDLGPLSRTTVAALAEATLGGPGAPQLTHQLFTRSGGNPFFAAELLRAWQESGTLTQIDGYWQLTDPAAQALPASIANTIRQRLSYQSAQTLDLLQTAAIVGRSFETALLASVIHRPIEEIEEDLDAATRAWLIQEGEPSSYAFRHDSMRECLYADVSTSRRRRLHLLIGEALKTRGNAAFSDLAAHFVRGGDRARGAQYSQQAAVRAVLMYGFEEAIQHYQTELDLIDSSAPSRGELLIGLGEALMLVGQERTAIATFGAARAWYRQRGDSQAAAHAAHRLGQALWRTGRF